MGLDGKSVIDMHFRIWLFSSGLVDTQALIFFKKTKTKKKGTSQLANEKKQSWVGFGIQYGLQTV